MALRYTLKQLEVFDAVANSGSISKASDTLALTQSATSMALSQLEKQLGQPLFERQGNKPMALTPWGVWLRPRAKEILALARQVETGLEGQQAISGEFNFASSQTPARHLMPHLIRLCDAEYPELRIQLTVTNTEQVIQGIKNYQYDLGMIEGRCSDNQITQELYCYDRLVIAAGRSHPLAKEGRASIIQLFNARWVLRERGSGTRDVFDQAMREVGDKLEVWREYSQNPVLHELVESGAYLGCFPLLDILPLVEQERMVILEVPGLELERPVSFIWRADAAHNPIRESIKQCAWEVAFVRNEKNVILAKPPE